MVATELCSLCPLLACSFSSPPLHYIYNRKRFWRWLLQASQKTQDPEKVFGPFSPGSHAQIISWGFPEDVCNLILYRPVLRDRNNSYL